MKIRAESGFHALRAGGCSIPLQLPELLFFQVPNEAAPNYALTVEPTKPVVS